MKTLLIVLVVLLLVVLVALGLVLARFGRRSYQRATGLDQQRKAAKGARMAGTERLKGAERDLVEAQRDLVQRGETGSAQKIEALRSELSTLADRLKYATYGYSPVGSHNPVYEAELAELQDKDAQTIADAQQIAALTKSLRDAVRAGENPGLEGLRSALDDLRAALDRRRAPA